MRKISRRIRPKNNVKNMQPMGGRARKRKFAEEIELQRKGRSVQLF